MNHYISEIADHRSGIQIIFSFETYSIFL